MSLFKNFLFVCILLVVSFLLYKTLVPVHFVEYNTPYFSARFPREPYHTVNNDYDLWDVSTVDGKYYFVYVNKLNSSQDKSTLAEISKQNIIKEINGKNKILNESFSLPAKFKGSTYVSYIDEEGTYWRFMYVVVAENNALYQIGVSSKKDDIEDLKFFLNTFKVKVI